MGAPLCLDLLLHGFPISLHGFHILGVLIAKHILGVLIAKHISNSDCGAIANKGSDVVI